MPHSRITLRRTFTPAFTLVELLIVIAIIAVLVSLLMPALTRARFEARLTVCMSNQRQIATAMIAYATDNEGNLPREDQALGVGDNTTTVTSGFWTQMTQKYGVPQAMMFCPFEPDDQVAQYQVFGFPIFGYGLWVPRADNGNGGLFPPGEGYSGNISDRDPSGSACGPVKVTDTIAATVPILTDVATTVYYSPPTGKFDDLSFPVPDYSLAFPGGYYHMMYSSRAGPMNEAFADGHVERRQPHEFFLRYVQGPFSDWR